jgi:hypothetical protein
VCFRHIAVNTVHTGDNWRGGDGDGDKGIAVVMVMMIRG